MLKQETGGGLTQEQQLEAELKALDDARKRGMPESEYLSAVASVKARYQSQAKTAGKGDPFTQGLQSNGQAKTVATPSAPAPSHYRIFKEKRIYAATHAPDQPSAFENGLNQGLGGGTTQPAAPSASSPEAQKLSNLLTNMQGKAPEEAIQQVQIALEKQKLSDTIAQMKEKNAPYEAIQSAQQALANMQSAKAVYPNALPNKNNYSPDAQKLADLLSTMKDKHAPDDAIQQVQASLDKQNEYDREKQAILNDNMLDSWDKNLKLQNLDDQYGKRKTADDSSIIELDDKPYSLSFDPKTKKITLGDSELTNPEIDFFTNVNFSYIPTEKRLQLILELRKNDGVIDGDVIQKLGLSDKPDDNYAGFVSMMYRNSKFVLSLPTIDAIKQSEAYDAMALSLALTGKIGYQEEPAGMGSPDDDAFTKGLGGKTTGEMPDDGINFDEEAGNNGQGGEEIKNVGDVIDGIKITEGKVGGKIPIDEYKAIRQSSIKNPNADAITLGKYTNGPDSYTARAGSDSSLFDMGDQWGVTKARYGLSDKEMFDYFNKPALDDAISSGKSIRFSHNPLDYDTGSLPAEWDYIKSKLGLTDINLSCEGGFWYVK